MKSTHAAFVALLGSLVLAPTAAAAEAPAAGAACDPDADIRIAMYGDSLCDGSIEPCDVLDAEEGWSCLNRCFSGYSTNRPISPEDPLSAAVPLLLDDLQTGLLDAEAVDYVVIASGANDVRPGDWSAPRDYGLPLRRATEAVLAAGMLPFLTVTHPQYETVASGLPQCTFHPGNQSRIEAVMLPTVLAISNDHAPPLPVLNLYEAFGRVSEEERCPGVFDDPNGIYRDHVHVTFGKGNAFLTSLYRRGLRAWRTRECPASAPACEVELPQTVYRTGDYLGWQKLKYRNRTETAIPDARVVVELFYAGVARIAPIDVGPVDLPVGWELDGPSAGLTIPADMPRGTWALRCALEGFGSGDVLAESEVLFELE